MTCFTRKKNGALPAAGTFSATLGHAIRLVAIYLGLGAIAFAGFATHVKIPVKVGQKEVDARRLPFACLTIGTAGVRVPIERIVVENLDSHKELTAQLGRLFGNDHPDYPFGADEKRRALSMAILELPPGRYRLKFVEFTPDGVGTNSITFTLKDENAYCFTVKPDCVNYVGSVIFFADWVAATTGGTPSGSTVERRFPFQTLVERSAKRDQKWAAKLIPCLAPLPSEESPFGQL